MCGRSDLFLTALKQQDGHLAQVKIDEMARFVGHVRTEIPAHYAMPRWVVFLVELLLDICRNILFNVVFL